MKPFSKLTQRRGVRMKKYAMTLNSRLLAESTRYVDLVEVSVVLLCRKAFWVRGEDIWDIWGLVRTATVKLVGPLVGHLVV